MRQPSSTADSGPTEDDPSVTHVFDVDDAAPYETQRMVQRYLSQDPRHNLLQVLFGHSSHLASTTELAYYILRSRSAISDQLVNPGDHGITPRDNYEPNADPRDGSSDFEGSRCSM